MELRQCRVQFTSKSYIMRNLKSLAFISGLGVALALTGCSTWMHQDTGGRTAGRVVDDNKITADVKSGLNQEPIYKFNEVDVKTFDGVVQLSGFVNTDAQKQRAGQIAQETRGVTQVVNSIALKPEGTTPTGRATGYNQNGYAPDNNNNNNPQPQAAPTTTPR